MLVPSWPRMTCPRCGQSDVVEAACPRCGVVFAKLRDRSTPRPSPTTKPVVPERGARPVRLGALLALAAAVALAGVWRFGRRPAPPPTRPAEKVLLASAPAMQPPPPPMTQPAAVVPATLPAVEASAFGEVDGHTVTALVSRVSLQRPLTAADIQSAEGLYARHAADSQLRDLLAAVLIAASQQEKTARHTDQAASYLRRASALRPGDTTARLSLLDLLLQTADWSGAEAAARETLALEPRNADALQGLAYALYRQDRNREAADAVHEALEARPDNPSSLWLSARLRKGMTDENGMREQHLSHFNVRYDGEAHEDVGREILRALERHYVTLVQTFDQGPDATIPVILFTRQGYYDASGAPAWSGGEFDGTDGRIRVPVMGLTSSLTPQMDDTLIHELTHAFINDRSRGLAPREIHEGLAQYMEGHRVATELTPEQLKALAAGRIGGPAGFYLGALSFVEHLMSLRGQGGINEVLRSMQETGSVDEAFRRVYGQDYPSTRTAWLERLRQQYGG